MQYSLITSLLAAGGLAACVHSPELDTTPTRKELITQGPFSVTIHDKDGQDITAALGIKQVQYFPDGTGTRTLVDGTVLRGTWRFLDPGETMVETTAPTGTNRWKILELTVSRYRKVRARIAATVFGEGEPS